jgi:hypothetical protein
VWKICQALNCWHLGLVCYWLSSWGKHAQHYYAQNREYRLAGLVLFGEGMSFLSAHVFHDLFYEVRAKKTEA